MAEQASTADSLRAPGETVAPQGSPNPILTSPLLWGGLLTAGFYALIPVLPVQRELAQRYFCSHPLEYATATLFFIGMAVLLIKALRLPRERRALNVDVLSDPEFTQEHNSERRARLIARHVQQLGDRFNDTCVIRRLRDVCAFVRGRRSSEGLEGHLKYLGEIEAERLHESHALVRTITWAVPILGFLGTVIGITMAIAEVTPEQLDESLGTVTGGLAIAFDTTALALALSLVMVFGSFLVQQAEQSIQAQVEAYSVTRFDAIFPPESLAGSPILDAEEQAASLLLERTEALMQSQNEIWRESLDAMRTRWLQTLDEQRQEFASALTTGTTATLTDHSEQLRTIRGELVQYSAAIAGQFESGVSALQASQTAIPKIWAGELNQVLEQARQQASAEQSAHQAAFGESVTGIIEVVNRWRDALDAGSTVAGQQLLELRNQTEVLLTLTSEQNKLVQLETRLTENLEAVRTSHAFEETLHSLNAAVHLLTARVDKKAA
ncbi:MAG: MotA/TolQ/ExbB proton channel family protein [Planctomycetota bacterium]|nr:MotA/TolQ/ExbB proton channel family protein [Planctomycetota bacterium]